MEKRNLTCIVCPMGCSLEVMLEDGKVVSVSGNTCPRGEKYAHEECTHPTRVLTSTVLVEGGSLPVASVKTKEPIPKEMLFQAMEEIRKMRVAAPVKIGQILTENLCGTGVALTVTGDVEERE
ncbi:MAG: DUF1667 domain-containing protein [Candidatus Merdivicinus sp.]|jgi:CxxC motif-containing protein